MASSPTPPSGTVTFLFTDIEGSTKRWEQQKNAMNSALSLHDALMREAIEHNGGYVFKTVGDAFYATFPTAPQALDAALHAQHTLQQQKWPPEVGEIQVRMALHTGAAEERGGDYFGPPLNRVARLLSAGHGGQTLLSEVAYGLVRDQLPEGVELRDMGQHRLKDLTRSEHVFEVAAPGLPSGFPPLKTLENRPNNLPLQPTPLIGREKEVEAVCALLLRDDTRMLTLTGPGGTGKTRMAMQAAGEVIEHLTDGAFFVDLAPLTDPQLVVSAIARDLGVRESGSQPLIDTMCDYLKGKRMLLVLDNFEQVVQAATAVSRILQAAPEVKVLVTSRVPLHIRGEKEYAVPPLSLPDAHNLPPIAQLTQYEAVRLFIDRATDVKADFEVDNQNAPAVAAICARLDGLPLPIELAAARVKFLSPQAILSRLESRLKLLTGGARDVHARQTTLRNTIAWSHDLLSAEEQTLFRRLAVFQGGRSLEAIETVCNPDGDLEMDVLDGVSSLVDKSLMRRLESTQGEPRFVMLETIHEYAREKLEQSGELDTLRRGHALYFTALAETAEPLLRGARQAEWLNRLEDEHDNFRAAIRWARQNAERGEVEAADAGLRLLGAFWRFWLIRGYISEGREDLESFLALPAPSLSGVSERAKPRYVSALLGAGMLLYQQGYDERARTRSEEALQLANEIGDLSGVALALNNMANMLSEKWGTTTDSMARARDLYEQSLAIRRRLGDKWGIAQSLNNIANIVAFHEENYPAARDLYTESLALWRELGDRRGEAYCLYNLGNILNLEEDYEGAVAYYEQCMVIGKELGDTLRISGTFYTLGLVAYSKKDYPAAQEYLKQAVILETEVGNRFTLATNLFGLAAVAFAFEEVQKGATLFGAAMSLAGEDVSWLGPLDRRLYDGAKAGLARQREEDIAQALQEGRAMSMEQAVEYALNEEQTA